MKEPYQRIKVPTSEQWNSQECSPQSAAQPRTPQGSSNNNSIAPLSIQPAKPSLVPMPRFLSNVYKYWLVGFFLVVLLMAATSLFAASAPQQELELMVQHAVSKPLEKIMTPPNNSQPVKTSLPDAHTEAGATTTKAQPIAQPHAQTQEKAVSARVSQPSTALTVAPIKSRLPDENTHANVAAVATTKPQIQTTAQPESQKNSSPVIPAPIQQPSATTKNVSAPEQSSPTLAQPIAQPTAQFQAESASAQAAPPPSALTAAPTTAEGANAEQEDPNGLDTFDLTLLALTVAGLAGAGAAASAGIAISTRRAVQADKHKSEVKALPVQEITPQPQPISSLATPPKKLADVAPQAAALAYIDQSDWAAALERAYGINTKPNPHRALVSLVGSRDENQDYGCLYDIQGHQGELMHCFFVADGCGGHIGGREASCLAVRAASEAVLQIAGTHTPEDCVQAAFSAASAALITAGLYWDANSLRTTLIVVLVDASHYYCGWIGDGGIDLHRANGKWLNVLVPHKSGAQNLLAASLGPDQVGEPSYATYPRHAGDRMYMSSDGVFDVYDDPAQFWGSWFENASVSRAPQTCLQELLAKCAEHTAFDDNMTVAYLHTPQQHVSTTSAKSPSALQLATAIHKPTSPQST